MGETFRDANEVEISPAITEGILSIHKTYLIHIHYNNLNFRKWVNWLCIVRRYCIVRIEVMR